MPVEALTTRNSDWLPIWMIGVKSFNTSNCAPVPALSTSVAIEIVFGVNSSV